ncbi:MAG: hypothetical protein K9G48_13780 [Reyranella sp.]|nr:hypothetical protein [Reyranella sp.]
MSVRSTLEINHDVVMLGTPAQRETFCRTFETFVKTGDKSHLPLGMKLLVRRHHSEQEPQALVNVLVDKANAALSEVDDEVEQRKGGGNEEDWTDLKRIADELRDALTDVELRFGMPDEPTKEAS